MVGPAVRVGRIVVEIQRAVAVCQGHAREVPECQHESEFFVRHVPATILSASKQYEELAMAHTRT